MKLKPIGTTEVEILGIPWTFELYSDIDYAIIQPEEPEDMCGETWTDKNTVIFQQTGMTKGVVRHELRHAYSKYLLCPSADLTQVQSDEYHAHIDEHFWDTMRDQVNEIYATLKRKR